MIRNINLNKQFLSTSNIDTPFKPYEAPPKTAKIYLNSQDKMTGTNADATFKVNLPTEFTTQKLNLTLNNFIPVYPTGTDAGIVQVDMIGVNNPYSFSSSNNNTHRTLGMFHIEREGIPKEYPPIGMTGDTTNITGQPYGNGTYIASITSIDLGFVRMAFDKIYNGFAVRTAFNGGYNTFSGFYTATTYSTVMSGTLYYGEHLTLEMPSPIVLAKYDYTSHAEPNVRCGNTWVVGGSTDGINWTLLDARSDVYWTGANQTQTFTVANNNTLFRYYRMLTTRVGNRDATQYKDDWGIAEWRLYGYSNPQMNYTITTTTSSNTTTSSLNAFDLNSNTAWNTGSIYNATTGVYQGTNSTLVDGSNMTGEWIELQTADQLILQNYTLVGDTNSNATPNTFTLAVSSNGTSYTRVHTQSNINNWSAPWSFTFSNSNVPTSNAYNRFRILTHTVGNGGTVGRSNVGIAEMRLTGYSNVGVDVTEFFIPPQPLTSNVNTQTGQPKGNGTYTASASSGSTTQPYLAFDYTLGGTVWTTSNLYNSTTGWYEGSNFTNVVGSNYTGEWLQIQTPYPVYLSFYDMAVTSATTSLNTFSLVASTNGSNFALIHTISNVGDWGVPNWYKNFTACNNIPTPEPYTHWRLVVHRVGNSNQSTLRTRPSIEVWQPRGFSSNRPYAFPPSNMTNTSTTFSNLLTLANGTYVVNSSSNIAVTTTSNTFASSGRIGQCNLNCEVLTTDRSLFNRPITFQVKSLTGANLSTMSNWSAEITVKEAK